MVNIFSVEALSRYGARCPGFREMLAKLRCAIDLEKLSAYELARLLDFGLAEREWGYLTSIYQDREV
jgi:hypothetical protein